MASAESKKTIFHTCITEMMVQSDKKPTCKTSVNLIESINRNNTKHDDLSFVQNTCNALLKEHMNHISMFRIHINRSWKLDWINSD